MIRMNVAGIALDASDSQPIVILNDSLGLRSLQIGIGVGEAAAIANVIKRRTSQRPLTHELMHNAIKQLGYVVTKVEIDELSSNTYYATIKLARPGDSQGDTEESVSLDARPSDAIALAMLAQAPILVAPEIILEAAIPVDAEKDAAAANEFRTFLQGVKASDFNNPDLGQKEPEIAQPPDQSTEPEDGERPEK
jgi:bifunctional DNase/RNase